MALHWKSVVLDYILLEQVARDVLEAQSLAVSEATLDGALTSLV